MKTAMIILLAPSLFSADGAAPAKAEEEQKLVAVLQSDAGLYEKAKACQKLAVIGGREAVPALAALLPDEKLSHYARFGLEPNPDPSANEALREAMGKLKGKLLLGVINSLGMRRDAGALEGLKKHLGGGEPESAAAAAAALGRIGTPEAAAILRESTAAAGEALRTALGDASLVCAERLLAGGKREEATALFDFLRQAGLPKHVGAAALQGSILARGEAGLPLLVESLLGSDPANFTVALGLARKLSGGAVTRALVDQLDKLPADRRALLIAALGDRQDEAAVPALLLAARSGPAEVRIAAIRALKTSSSVLAVAVLLDAAAGPEAGPAAAALETLEALGGKEVDAGLAQMLDTADARLRPVLIELAGRRRIGSARPALRKAADDESEPIRLAAVRALGLTAEVEDVPILIARFVKPRSPGEGTAAEEALKTSVKRLPDKDGSAGKVLEAMESAPAEARIRLIEILRAVGGKRALGAVAAGAKSPDSATRDAARKALGEWASEDAAPEILALVKESSAAGDRSDLLGRFKNVVSRLRFPKEQRLALCGQAMEAARGDEERRVVVQTYAAIPAQETLALLKPYLKDSGLKEEASAAMVGICDRILRYDPSAVREPLRQALQATEKKDLAERAKKLLEQAGGKP
jgi:HEAT repeat protein